jgi:hypothetical protein
VYIPTLFTFMTITLCTILHIKYPHFTSMHIMRVLINEIIESTLILTNK